MEKCVITSAVRTPVGTFLGSLKTVEPQELGSIVIKEAVRRSNIDKNVISEVIMGCVINSGFAPNIARVASLQAGLDVDVSAFTVDRQCGSGLQAVISATQEIQTGAAEVVVAGGVESMSRAPYLLAPDSRYKGLGAGHFQVYDTFVYGSSASSPKSMYPNLNMGITAENIAKKYNISREAQDEFALDSQNKTAEAINKGYFKEEIIPVEVKSRKETNVFDTDEHPRFGITIEKLAKLRPSFIDDGTVTAGNSSGLNDGSSAVVVMSESKAKQLGAKPMVKILSSAVVGVDPRYMGMGPVGAISKALKLANLELKDMDLIEINEAFAAQSIGCLIEMGMAPGTELYKKFNVSGGAIAHGHALGNSGTRILSTLIYELKRRGGRYGVLSLCIGGGQGIAMVIENC